MTVQTRTERITAPDGSGSFDGHVTLPASGAGPGLLVIQEIFGVNHYVRTRCADLARLGYVSMAPDAFWRLAPNIELGIDPQALERGVALGQAFDANAGVADLRAALQHLRRLPEVGGRDCGVIGFCFGGTMAFALACHADPSVVVSYYGSGVCALLDQADAIACPVQLHFGSEDPYIPAEDIARIGAFAAGRPTVEHHVYAGAGHAFDNEFNPMFANAEAQHEAWRATRVFLGAHLSIS